MFNLPPIITRSPFSGPSYERPENQMPDISQDRPESQMPFRFDGTSAIHTENTLKMLPFSELNSGRLQHPFLETVELEVDAVPAGIADEMPRVRTTIEPSSSDLESRIPGRLYEASNSFTTYPQLISDIDLLHRFENLQLENFSHLDSHLDPNQVELLFGLISSLSESSDVIAPPSTLSALIKDLQEKHPKMQIRPLVESLQKIDLNMPSYTTIITAIKEALVAKRRVRDGDIGQRFLSTIVRPSVSSSSPVAASSVPSPSPVAASSDSSTPSDSKAPKFKIMLTGAAANFFNYGSYNFENTDVHFSEDQIKQLIKSPSISMVTRGYQAELEGVVKFSELFEIIKKNSEWETIECIVKGIETLQLPLEKLKRIQRALQIGLDKNDSECAYNRVHLRTITPIDEIR